MEPINLNHVNYLSQLKYLNKVETGELTFEAVNKADALKDQVTLSPTAIERYLSEQPVSRFVSLEAQSESKTRLVNETWLTLEELQTGIRKPFVGAEEARLSTLTLTELMQEMDQLPSMDKHGHLQAAFAGTEQGDRLASAVANIVIQSQYNLKTTSENVSTSLEAFKADVAGTLGIDPEKYTIKYLDGKMKVVGVGQTTPNDPDIQKIQALIDDPEKNAMAKQLVSDIEAYNQAASEIINNMLIQHTLGGSKNRYLPKELTLDQIMEDADYGNTKSTSHIGGVWLDTVAKANESYRQALKDGTHLKNSGINPGILELNEMRKNANSANKNQH